MKTKFLILFFVLWSNYANCSNYDTINTNAQVFATYFDSTSNILYAGGVRILIFQNNSWSYFSPTPPAGIIWIITKYNNELYIGGSFGVAKFDGTNWISLPTALITSTIYELFEYDNNLYAFNGGNMPYLTVWNGIFWSQVDPGVSSIGCSGIQTMFIYNNELYANSSGPSGAAVIIKKVGNNWTFPNGIHYNTYIRSHCVFNNNLYLTDGDWVKEYNGVSWRTLDFCTLVDGSGGWDYIKKIRSDGNRLFIAGGFDKVGNAGHEYLNVNNIFSWCGDDLISPIETGLSNDYPIRDFNFYNNKLYVFELTGYNGEQAPLSIIDSLDDLPDPLISISDTAICQGEQINISEISNTGLKWLWEIDDSVPIILYTQNISLYFNTTGFHTVKVTVYNCVGGSSKVFSNLIYVYPTPSTPTIHVIGDTLFSSSLYNNHWFYNGTQLPDTSNFIIFNLTFSTYIQVIVTNQFGCSASSDLITQIEKYYSDAILEVFPNPTNGLITLQNNNSTSQDYLLTVKTIQGEEVLSRKIKFINSYNLDLMSFKNGVYFLTLKNDKEQFVKKIELLK
jgi:hypothetical protein